MNEVSIPANLRLPYNVLLFDSGGTIGFLGQVMPRVEAASQPLTEESVGITESVTSGLDCAECRDTIHGYVKAGSIAPHEVEQVVADLGKALTVSGALVRVVLEFCRRTFGFVRISVRTVGRPVSRLAGR